MDGGTLIGYACLAVGVEGTKIRTCRLKNATGQRVLEITAANLKALERLIDYNAGAGIRLFRISSDIVPFASHPSAAPRWKEEFSGEIERIGRKIRDAGIRVSMHPGQYTVLNSPEERVAENAALDLTYHADFLDALGAGRECRIILHAGGAYGDKRSAMERFVRRAARLPERIQGRIALENDDKSFTAADILEISAQTGFPAVFDNLHHMLNPPRERLDDAAWIQRCAATWGADAGRPKIHYSQAGGKRGAHSGTIDTERFLAYCRSIGETDADIMLEVKDKNVSAVKCMNALKGRVPVRILEEEWARYKYLVLSRSAAAYNDIREFLKEKGPADAAAFYAMIDRARMLPADAGAQKNAAQHVWGYFRDRASRREKERFLAITGGTAVEAAAKRFLLGCAHKYGEPYLLESYYFYLD